MAISQYKRYPKSYDYVVVGTNLSSKLTAYYLSLHSESVLLVDSYDSASSFSNDFNEDQFYFNNLEFMEASNENKENFEKLNSLFKNLQISAFPKDVEVKTFENGKFKTFLGFGAKTLKVVNEYEHYNRRNQLLLTTPLSEYFTQINQAFKGDRLSQASLTAIEFQENQISNIIINGSNRIHSKNFIFCLPPSQIFDLIPNHLMPGRLQQKIATSKIWSSLQLTITHDKKLDFSNHDLYFLMGKKPEDEICIGRFSQSKESKYTTSQWVSFINEEFANDYNYIGGHLKYIKKQIKRAFPDIFSKSNFEKINVYKENHGHINLSKKDWTAVKNLKNFYLISPHFFKSIGFSSQVSSFLNFTKEVDLEKTLSQERKDFNTSQSCQ